MADKKVTQLSALTAPANTDILLIVDDPAGTPVSKKITVGDIFGETAQTIFQSFDIAATGDATIGADTLTVDATTVVVDGEFEVASNKIRIRTLLSDFSTSNNAAEQLGAVGTIGVSANYLYVAVGTSGANTIKRVALSGW